MLMEEEQRTTEAVSEAGARASLYSLLSRVFLKETDAEFASLLSQPDISGALLEMGVTIDPEALVADLERLAHEYCYLFVGPGPHLPPFESANARSYTDKDGELRYGQLLGDLAMEVERTYLSYGLTLGPELKDQPDHIAAELAFMAHLCELEAQAVMNGDGDEAAAVTGAQKDFLQRHIGSWAPGYCRLVQEASDTGFYTEFASLTAGFIESENAVV